MMKRVEWKLFNDVLPSHEQKIIILNLNSKNEWPNSYEIMGWQFFVLDDDECGDHKFVAEVNDERGYGSERIWESELLKDNSSYCYYWLDADELKDLCKKRGIKKTHKGGSVPRCRTKGQLIVTLEKADMEE